MARNLKSTVCKTCDGKGAVKKPEWPKKKPTPCYWFNKPCDTCPDCSGTGEAE